MRTLLSAVFLLAACRPIDTERVKVRGNGMTLEVVATSDPDQVHMRHFEIAVEPAAALEVVCRAPGERHRRTWPSTRNLTGALYGLLANTAYECGVTSTREGRSLTADLSFTTEPIELETPPFDLSHSGTAWGDYTLFNTWQTGGGAGKHHVLVVDDEARIRWSFLLEGRTSAGLEVTPISRTSLLVGGGRVAPQRLALDGTVRWAFPELPNDNDRFWHHDADLTPQGTVLGLHAEPNQEGEDRWAGFTLVERDPDTDQQLWTWSSADAYARGELPRGTGDDPWHANAITRLPDEEGGHVIVSLPAVDRVVCIDPSTDRIVWQLGSGLDFSLVGNSWFSGQHDPEWSDGRLLIHDNGTRLASSRVLELELNQDQMQAEVLWEWTEPAWFEPLWGDADRLVDGSVMVTRGHCGFCAQAASGPSAIRIFDPTSGAVRWELTLRDLGWGLYRAERVDGCALFHNEAVCSPG